MLVMSLRESWPWIFDKILQWPCRQVLTPKKLFQKKTRGREEYSNSNFFTASGKKRLLAPKIVFRS